ncbi:hypothetical protein Tco_1459524 [Tanacetum coccineum]
MHTSHGHIPSASNEICDDDHKSAACASFDTYYGFTDETGLSNKSNQVYDRGCRWVLLMLLPTLTMVSLVGYMAVKDYRYTCWYLLLFLKLADTCFFLLKLADACFFLLKLATTSSLMVLLLSYKCVSDEAC